MAGLRDYELQSQIGAGASGTVWRALRPGPVPQVAAVKRLRPGTASDDGLARLQAEAAILTELDHPHVVKVLEVVPDGDGVAICMQYAPGGSLDAVLAARGRLTPGETVGIAVPIAEALASAHRRGVVHGDVKPANVLFTSDGEPLLGDFGVARSLGQLPGAAGSVDAAGAVVSGTAAYLAPELLDGAAPDARSDVYSLAVVCYEALTGRLPYDGPTPDAVVAAARRGGHEPLTARRSVPAPLATVIEQALARDPHDRVATADLLARGLRAALPPGDIRLPPVPAPPTPVRVGPSAPTTTVPGDGDVLGDSGVRRDLGTHDPSRLGSRGDIRDPGNVDRGTPAGGTGMSGSLTGRADAAAGTLGGTSGDRGHLVDGGPLGGGPLGGRRFGERTDLHDAGDPDGLQRPGDDSGHGRDRGDLGGPDGWGPPGSLGGRPAGASGPAGDDPVRATRTFGPRPPRPEPAPPRRRARLPVGVLAALVLAGVIYLARGPLGDGGGCPEVARPTVGAGVQVVAGDPEGDGCETYGTYQLRALRSGEQAMVLTIPVGGEERGIRLGDLGDQVLLGDWDCDGTDTPGLYRRSQGEVRRFDTWPEVEDRRYEPEAIEPAPPLGRATVVRSGDGDSGDGGHAEGGRCDRIQVRSGTTT